MSYRSDVEASEARLRGELTELRSRSERLRHDGFEHEAFSLTIDLAHDTDMHVLREIAEDVYGAPFRIEPDRGLARMVGTPFPRPRRVQLEIRQRTRGCAVTITDDAPRTWRSFAAPLRQQMTEQRAGQALALEQRLREVVGLDPTAPPPTPVPADRAWPAPQVASREPDAEPHRWAGKLSAVVLASSALLWLMVAFGSSIAPALVTTVIGLAYLLYARRQQASAARTRPAVRVRVDSDESAEPPPAVEVPATGRSSTSPSLRRTVTSDAG